MKLHEKIAIVTGAGSEMGSAITRAFAVEGAKVVAVDVDEQSIFNQLHTLGDIPGVIYRQDVDLTRLDNVRQLVEETYQRFGRLDILVNSAVMREPPETPDEMWWRKVLDAQLIAALELCQESLYRMAAQEKGGCIVNVTPSAGRNGKMGDIIHTVCAYGIVGMTRGIALQYAAQNIRCNAICPGNVGAPGGEPVQLPPEWMHIDTPGNIRQGSPEEIAAAALFLAGEGASFVNGATLVVNGGTA